MQGCSICLAVSDRTERVLIRHTAAVCISQQREGDAFHLILTGTITAVSHLFERWFGETVLFSVLSF